ncbi:MAG: PIN domain-containing protein [Aeromicrobium sp.]|jgi:predicted nucleic acid-binding protein|nr:PIN domain-containing protein [Aeromicrobium sp.]
MSAGALIDTNVLAYSYDTGEPHKREQAMSIVARLAGTGQAALTTQVLGEHHWVIRRRFTRRFTAAEAAEQTAALSRAFPVYDTTLTVVLEALRGTVRYQMPYYDAQIWAVARVNHIPLVLSEDFSDGAVIEGVRFADPFADGFDLEACLGA